MLRTTGAQQPLQNTQAPAHKPFRRQKSHWATIFKRLLTPGHQWGIAHPAACDKSEVTFLMLKFSSVTLRWMSLSDYTQRNPKPSCSFPRGEKKLCSKALVFHSLYLHITVTSPLLNCHTIYPGKEGTVQRGLTSNQHFGEIFLFQLVDWGRRDPSWKVAIALNTQEVWALGPSTRLNDDSRNRRVTRLEAPAKGTSPRS